MGKIELKYIKNNVVLLILINMLFINNAEALPTESKNFESSFGNSRISVIFNENQNKNKVLLLFEDLEKYNINVELFLPEKFIIKNQHLINYMRKNGGTIRKLENGQPYWKYINHANEHIYGNHIYVRNVVHNKTEGITIILDTLQNQKIDDYFLKIMGQLNIQGYERISLY
ncbi:hypothetical protein [Acetoanaerobium sticklandii]|uniref:hypothetical protein n=1 Tax=Acetoanaerobium sticklandii TaxID=1511 RepID=UPI003A95451C